jgi:outer membrane protein assembly factor BamB
MDLFRRLSLMLAALSSALVIGLFTHAPRADETRAGASQGGPAPAKLSQATLGGSVYRNMVNLVDKNVPTSWSVEPTKLKNIKWVAEVGSRSYGGPVIYDGRVFVGTNNDKPRDPKLKGQKLGVLMCFDTKDGKFLWQNTHAEPPEEVDQQAIEDGMCSTPTVEGKFVYYCTPAVEVVCAQTEDGKIVWRKDLMQELKVVPLFVCACSPLVVGDAVYVVTGNGTDGQNPPKVMVPKAPSFVALNKKDGKVLWAKDYPGTGIIDGQWASPVYAEPGGKPQIVFPGGDDYLYGLEPATGEVIWKFDCRPKPDKAERGITPYFVATPVVWDNKVYVGLGAYPDNPRPPRLGHFYCVDVTKKGDVSCKGAAFDPKDPANKDSGLVWYYGGVVQPPPEKGRAERIQRTMSSASAHDGLVYIAEERGYLQCLDAKTGQRYWEHDFQTDIWGSTYWVDGKIYIGTGDGEVWIFQHGKNYQMPSKVEMDEPLRSTPVVVDGVLYIATPHKVYAISAGK